MSTIRNIVIFIGPPGAGKGTLSQLFVQQRGWAQLSTGNLCRYHIAEKTEIGRQIDLAIKSGKLISDSVIVDMVENALPALFEQSTTVILDGFPRTVVQAQALENRIAHLGAGYAVQFVVVVLHLDDEKLVKRLTSRLVCKNKDCQAVYSTLDSQLSPKNEGTCDTCRDSLVRRSDDEEAAVRDRLVLYHHHADGLIGFYKTHGYQVYEFDVDQPLETTFERVTGTMGTVAL